MKHFINQYAPHKVNRKLIHHQRGQAMSEALLILGIFFLLMLGIQVSITMQLNAVQSLLDSVKKVFQVHLGNVTTTAPTTIQHSKMQDLKKLIMSDAVNLLSPRAHALFQELNIAQPGSIHARSLSDRQSWGSIKISRQSFIESGHGSASSDQEVQERIGVSVSLWNDVFKHSSNTMESVHTLTAKIDTAWKRPQIYKDFLKPWTGVVPEQSLLQDDTWRN